MISGPRWPIPSDAPPPPLPDKAGILATWDTLECLLFVSGISQRLHRMERGRTVEVWPISTGTNGFGCRMHSGQTPVGWHRIWMRIGSGAPLGTVFKARRPTGQIRPDAPPSHGDWITTRILWLEGLEPGLNQGSDVDTRRRYIYIHGTPHTSDLGKPVSAGCVRMEGRDILTLFSRVRIGDPVFISSG